VFDETTGARLCGFKASATDDMQTFNAENLQVKGCDSTDTVIALNYAGKYTVAVEKPGYTPWKKDIEIIKESNQCSGYVEHIKVKLSPSSITGPAQSPPEKNLRLMVTIDAANYDLVVQHLTDHGIKILGAILDNEIIVIESTLDKLHQAVPQRLIKSVNEDRLSGVA
jgi:hypothetical protein